MIICSGADVWLVRGDQREKRNTIAPEYTVLKTIDHIPLGLFVLLDHQVDKPLSEETKKTLASMRLLGQRALPALSQLNYPAATRERLRGMLQASEGFENKALQAGTVSRAELDAFIDSMRTGTMANVDDAVALELGALDAAVRDFRKQMTEDEWRKLHVIVTDGHMPRDRERRMQYFAALLNQKQEGDRLIYQEGSSDIDVALDLLATHILDESISREYFKGDRWRMHRDLLSDAAAKWLKQHPPLR